MKSGVLITFVLLVCASVPARTVLKSPSGDVQAIIDADSAGRLTYAVFSRERVVLNASPIGVVVDGKTLGQQVQIGKVKIYKASEEFAWRGNKSEVKTSWREALIPMRETGLGLEWQLEVRCYDDGVAYRSIIPGQGTRQVSGEAAAWVFPEGSLAWCQPNTANYEGIHLRRAVNQLSTKEFTNGIGMPITVELPAGGYLALTEAEVMGYSGMTLAFDGSWMLRGEFRDNPKGWPMQGTIKTPWRVLMVAEDLNTLVNCDIVPALCPAPNPQIFPKGVNTDWLKPGRMLWQWWAYDDPGTHWSKQKAFIDDAATLNCQYYLVDEGWEHTRQEWASGGKDVWERLKELCDYAATKKVGIWVWRGWTYDPKRQWPGLETPEKRREFFKRCAAAGVKGTKIDFMDSESHDMLAFYEDCTRVAAENKIMVNFHGANKPAGEERTWPNEMTREGIRGLEYNKWSILPPEHYVTLPFTRYLVGPGDFTPTTFQEPKLKGTTFGGQLATAVVFTSPVLCWADKPELYLSSPAAGLIRTLPTTWDETRVLPGSKIGELAVFARRTGRDWYVGIVNGPQARDYTLDLHFLEAGRWEGDFYHDAPGEKTRLVAEHNVAVRPGSPRPIHLEAGGGFVGWLRR